MDKPSGATPARLSPVGGPWLAESSWPPACQTPSFERCASVGPGKLSKLATWAPCCGGGSAPPPSRVGGCCWRDSWAGLCSSIAGSSRLRWLSPSITGCEHQLGPAGESPMCSPSRCLGGAAGLRLDPRVPWGFSPVRGELVAASWAAGASEISPEPPIDVLRTQLFGGAGGSLSAPHGRCPHSYQVPFMTLCNVG